MDKRSIKRAQAKKRMRRIFLSAFIILMLITAGSLAYVWYSGKNNTDSSLIAEPLENHKKAEIKHIEQADNSPQGVAIQSITSLRMPGDNASVYIKTNMKSTCSVSVIYDKTASKDSGLVEKEVDSYGTTSWSWTIDSDAPLGRWPVKITCWRTERPEVSGVVVGYVELVSQIESDIE